MEWKLSGYRRSNGTVGVRNHVAVLAAADNVNPLASQFADRTPGTTFIRASFGRGQLGDDFKLALRAMAGMAAHPNVLTMSTPRSVGLPSRPNDVMAFAQRSPFTQPNSLKRPSPTTGSMHWRKESEDRLHRLESKVIKIRRLHRV
jgi:altronate dehydratase large subunit